jgi:hypothetical protein
MHLSPTKADSAHNQSRFCKAANCDVSLEARNRSGYCRKCFCAYATHPRKGGVHDSERMTRVSRSRLAWCPIDLQPAYRHLTRRKEIPAKEARAIIEQHMQTQVARYYGDAR